MPRVSAAAAALAKSRAVARAVIKSIREDLTISGPPKIQRMLDNAIGKLAKNVYSTDGHFIYEFIQNAADNSYPEGVRPELRFKLWDAKDGHGHGTLAIINNEIGFTADDVRAICDLGESTKTKERAKGGYIGEKGMGFKCVFSVAWKVDIYSPTTGFQFTLTEQPDPELKVRYIAPKVIEDDCVPDFVRENPNQTVFVLHLKLGKYKFIKEGLSRLPPTLFYGLSARLPAADRDPLRRQLECLIVDVEGCPILEASFERKGLDCSAESSATAGRTKFPPTYSELSFFTVKIKRGNAEPTNIVSVVHDERIALPADDVDLEPSRKGVLELEIRVVMALSSESSPSLTGQVYAYLPTKLQSGLPFTINGDFVLVASREDMQDPRENGWNARYLQFLPYTFIRGFLRLLKHKDELDCWYAYANIPQNGNGHFVQVYRTVREELQKASCVLCEDGMLRLPRDVLIGARQLYRLLEGKPTPATFARRPLVAASIVSAGKDVLSALGHLGVRYVGGAEYLEWLSDSAWRSSQSPKWVVELINFLMSDAPRGIELMADWRTPENLSPLNLIPSDPPASADWRPFVCLRPTDAANGLAHMQAVQACEAVSEELPVAHPPQAILNARAKSAKFKTFVDGTLGLQSFNFSAWLQELAQRLSAQADEEKLTPERSVEVMDFLQERWSLRLDSSGSITHDARSVLREVLPILSDSGLFVSGSTASKPMVLPPNAVGTDDNEDFVANWPLVLPEPADRAGFCIISSKYLESAGVPADARRVRAWRDFFVRVLNIPRTPPFPCKSVALDAHKLMMNKSFTNAINATDLSALLRDPRAKIHIAEPLVLSWLQLRSNVVAGSPYTAEDLARVVALVKWFEELDVDLAAKVVYEYKRCGRQRSGTAKVESKLLCLLRQCCWVPTTAGLQKPSAAYLSEDRDAAVLLGDKRPCVAFDVPANVGAILGFKTSKSAVELADVHERLLQLRASQDAPNMKFLESLYGFVYSRRGVYGEKMQGIFAAEKDIYVPSKGWFKSSEVVWSNGEDLASGLLPELVGAYPGLKSFFVDVLGVKEHLDERFFAERWNELSRRPVPVGREARAAFELQLKACYVHLEKMLNEGHAPNWWTTWRENAAVYAGDAFIPASERDSVLLPDSDLLETLFAGAVTLAWIPPGGGLGSFRALFAALALRPISEVADPKIDETTCKPIPRTNPSSKLTRKLRESTCQMLFNVHKDVYIKAKENKRLEVFLRAVDRATATLDVTYTLKSLDGSRRRSIVKADPDRSAFFDWQNGTEDGSFNLWWKATPTKKGRGVTAVVEPAAGDLAYSLAREIAACLYPSVARLAIDCRESARRLALEDSLQALFIMDAKGRAAKAKEHKWVLPDVEGVWVAAILDDADKALEAEMGGPITPETGADPDFDPATDAADGNALRKRKKGRKTGEPQPPAPGKENESAARKSNGGGAGKGGRKSNTAAEKQAEVDAYEEENSEPAPKKACTRAPATRSRVAAGLAERGEANLEALEPTERKALKDAAVQLILEHEARRGWVAERVEPQLQRGAQLACDIVLRRAAGGAVVRRIEVQALKGEWGTPGVSLAGSQVRAAVNDGDNCNYWVYVVEHMGEPAKRRLHTIPNPVMYMKLLRVDGGPGWRGAAESFLLGPSASASASVSVFEFR